MLAHEVENGEAGSAVGCNGIVVVEQSFVVAVCFLVAVCELCLGEFGVVEKESAAEVIDSFFGFGEKLIGEEGYLVACFFEELGEERIVAPLALLSDGVEGEDFLEDKGCEIPVGYDVGVGYEPACFFAGYLPWCGWEWIAVLL